MFRDKIPNRYIFNEDKVILVITSCSGKEAHAVIDRDEYENVRRYHWHISKGYVLSGRHIKLANTILKTSKKVDHKDLDPLNNLKSNLRECTISQNGANRPVQKNNITGIKGVGWYPRLGKWRARIKKGGALIHLGYFNTQKDAAEAYNSAALELFGEFAYLNAV